MQLFCRGRAFFFIENYSLFWQILQARTGSAKGVKTGENFPHFHPKTHHFRPDISVTIKFPVLKMEAENERNAGGLRV
jgi:hypothetical protein